MSVSTATFSESWTMISYYIQFSRRALGVFRLRGHGTLSDAVLVVISYENERGQGQRHGRTSSRRRGSGNTQPQPGEEQMWAWCVA